MNTPSEDNPIEFLAYLQQDDSPPCFRDGRIIWPFGRVGDEWTISDNVLLGVWNRLVELDRVKTAFYDGRIQDGGEFIAFMKRPEIFPILVVDSEKVRFFALAWLGNFINGMAVAQFCHLDGYQRKVIQQILDWWSKIDSLKVIVGITPKSHGPALKMVQHLGFRNVGTIPEACNMYYENRREAGVITYYLTEGRENGDR